PDLKMRPTEYYRRNVFVACRGDEMTLPSVIALAGDDNLVFNTDYPHPDGTFPWGIERLAAQPIPESSKRKILWDNAARAFHLEALRRQASGPCSPRPSALPCTIPSYLERLPLL